MFKFAVRVGVCVAVLFAAGLEAKPVALRQAVVCPPVRLRLSEGCMAEQLPPLETFRYQVTRTYSTGEVVNGEMECYAPEQLWRSEQCLGVWKDKQGNRFELLTPTSRKVGPYAQEHISRETYDAERKVRGALRPNELGDWIKEWSGENCSRPEALKPIGEVRQARFATTANDAFLIFFLKSLPNQPYILRVHPSDGAPKAWKNVLAQSLGGLGASGRATASAPSPGKGWNAFEKPPYRVYTNLPRKDYRALNRLLEDMQVIRTAYATAFPQPKNQETPLSTIRVFGSQREYQAYVGEGMEWSSGVFSSTKRELVVLADSDSESNKERRAEMRMIAFHEGFHQYLFLVTPSAVNVPIWFNEGHATYFETFRIRGGKGSPSLSPRLEVARSAKGMRSAQGLAALMSKSHDAFYDVNRNEAYAVAWLLVHWLRSEADAPYDTLLDRYYALLCKGTSPEEAQKQLFPLATLEAIAKGLDTYLSKHHYEP